MLVLYQQCLIATSVLKCVNKWYLIICDIIELDENHTNLKLSSHNVCIDTTSTTKKNQNLTSHTQPVHQWKVSHKVRHFWLAAYTAIELNGRDWEAGHGWDKSQSLWPRPRQCSGHMLSRHSRVFFSGVGVCYCSPRGNNWRTRDYPLFSARL